MLYIAPDASGPFVELTECVHQFAEVLPYGGQCDGIVPHLSVAHGSKLEHSRAETVLQAALRLLPERV